MSLKIKIFEMSRAQRLIAVIAASALLLVLFAHNPFSGYIINDEHTYSYEKPLEKCDDSDKDKYRKFLTSFYASDSGEQDRQINDLFIKQAGGLEAYIEKRVGKCHLLDKSYPIDIDYINEYKTTITVLPFSDWRSDSPIIGWFGYVLHFLYSIIFIVVVSVMLIFFVFGVKSNESSQA